MKKINNIKFKNEQDFKKYLIKTRKQIIENANDLLNNAIYLFENKNFQRATFCAMTCIEECGKLFLLRCIGLNNKQKYLQHHREVDKLLLDHTGKALETAVNSFFINSGADRRQGKNLVSGESRTNGIIILTRSNKWMQWRNSCLYVDVNISNNLTKTPKTSIGKPEAYYFICMAFEALAENAESGYGTIDPFKSHKSATKFWQNKLNELSIFMHENKKLDIDQIDFLLNPSKYRKLYKA